MKQADLKKGMLVAVTGGSGRYDRGYGHGSVRKAEVIEVGINVAKWGGMNDHTKVRLLDEPKGMGYGRHMRQPEDAVIAVPTRNIWQPWEEYAEGVAAYNIAEANREVERKAWKRAAKARTKRFEALLPDQEDGELRYYGDDVELKAEAFDKLLDLAEGK